jgi:5-(aminomethyl)-3-furanmethanol phosphate kinase
MLARTEPILVIKVGGSLVETGRAGDVLKLIASSQRRVIVVPGGGVFADKVRDLQKALQFDDAAAHRLAMLGMHQMSEVFRGLEAKLENAPGPDEISDAWAAGRVPLWVPLPLMDADATVPQSWDTTSDTLAARLTEIVSHAIGPAELVLLKSVDFSGKAFAQTLSDEGVVDRAFPIAVARSGVTWRIIGPANMHEFASQLGVAVVH